MKSQKSKGKTVLSPGYCECANGIMVTHVVNDTLGHMMRLYIYTIFTIGRGTNSTSTFKRVKFR